MINKIEIETLAAQLSSGHEFRHISQFNLVGLIGGAIAIRYGFLCGIQPRHKRKLKFHREELAKMLFDYAKNLS